MERYFNLFTVLKKLKECVGFFFFNNLIATNYLLREPFAKKSSQKQQKNERKANKNR